MGALFPNTRTVVNKVKLSSARYLLFTDGAKVVFSQTRDKITNRAVVLWKPGFSGMPESFTLKQHNEWFLKEARLSLKKKKKNDSTSHHMQNQFQGGL